MNELSKYLVEQILLEDENPIKKIVVIYVGRFQPFHKGHYGTYSHLVKKFGKDNVFIGTSNKTEKPKSPFNFKEKVKIMNTMFGIPTSKIHQVKNPYKPTEILSKFDEESTAFITVVGEKDKNRLGGKYFTPYKGTADEPYKDRGYVYAAPSSGGGVSGTEVRNGLSVGSDEQKEDFFKNRAYGKFNKSIFKMITDKLNEGVIEIPKERIEEWLINESSVITTGQVDDGPNFFFPNYDVFSRISAKRAAKIGYEVVNMIMSKDIEDYYDHPNYPNGPTKSVSYFPAGVIGAKTPNNQIDVYSSGAYTQWFKHATRKASLVGYELVMTQRAKEQLAKEKSQSGGEAKGDKELKDEFEKSLNEAITLPVEIGDTILTGRFKNKKTVVKSIGKDEHGMPTINGKKVVTFRMVNEGFHAIFEDEKEDEKYTHVGGGSYKLKGKEQDPKSPTFQKDDSGKYIELDKDGNEKPQPKTGTTLKTKDVQDRVDKEKETRQRMNGDDDSEKEEQDNWEKIDDKNNYYKSVRKYTDEELEDETGEYFENETTMKTAPNAFKDKDDMIEKVKNAKPVYLSSEEMENMNNTDMGDILNSKNPKQTAKERADEYGKDISWQYDSIEKGEKVPAPIALRDKNGEYHLLAGNTRAMAFTAAGKKLPIKVIDYDGEFQYNESISESNWPKSKLSTQHEKDFDHHLNYRLSKKFKGKFEVIGFDLYHNGKKLFTIDKRDTYNSVLRKVLYSLKESVNEIAGTAVRCEKCNHSWEIEREDTEKYLCHSCGWDSQKQEYDYDAFDSWKEKMGLDEALTPAQRARRQWLLAPQASTIKRKRQRTMIRKKSHDKLKKIALKMAWRDVYEFFRKRLYPDVPKEELTVIQKKQIEKWVAKKKRKVLKKARWKYWPMLRDKEAQKFKSKEDNVFEMSKSTLNKIEKYAEKQLSPEDIEFTKHFFDRVNDPRNGKEISDAELTGFFKRLSRFKKQFKDFLEKYNQIVVKDKRSDINIPFVKQANQIIAKTVMRKDDFKTSNPVLAFEQLAQGMSLRDIAEKHDVSFEELSKEAKKGVKVEMEHTSDVKQAYNIAKDHLFEDPKYYTKLATIEELAPHGYPDQEWMDNHEKKMKKLRKQLDSMNEELIMEGGAYGHMNHPFDTEINLTFGDLKDIVNRALDGNLELTREKTDGQALAISWRDGRLVAARNKGHLKNKGENALDIKGVADKFAGRGELEKAYNFAMNDLSKAIKSLSEKQREKIFKGGACFMNLEVIYPTSVNVIPYGQALLVFHGTMEYDESGTAIGQNQEAARVLAGMIKQVNQNVQSNYTIQGPPVIQLPKNQDLSSQKGKFTSQISKLQKEFGLKDTDGVAEYHQAWWSNWIDKNSPSTLDNKTKMGLVKRWAFMDKSFRLDNKNITDEKVLNWAQKVDKEDQSKISKQNLMKFEDIFLGVGAEVLQFTSSVLTVNPDKAVRDIKKRIDQTIKDVRKSGDPKKIEKLKLELKRLNAIGGPDKIVPNEGIVFVYKGNTFKLTGAFASVNQLLGIFF